MSDPQAPGQTPSPDESAPSVVPPTDPFASPQHEDPTPPDVPVPADGVVPNSELGGADTVAANDQLSSGGVDR